MADELPTLLSEPFPCTRPPRGWMCSREAEHDGPCAAWPLPDPEPKPLISRAGLAALGLVIGALSACFAPPEDPWEEFEGIVLEDADNPILRLGT